LKTAFQQWKKEEPIKKEKVVSKPAKMPIVDYYITKHFRFFEMTETSHRDLLKHNRNEKAVKLARKAGRDLCQMLEKIRAYKNQSIHVSSGYRSPELNTAISGSKTSQHMKFEAADIWMSGVPLGELFNWIWKESNLEFGQLILEGYTSGQPTWIHISLGYPYRPKDKCGQVYKASKEDGKWVYKRLDLE